MPPLICKVCGGKADCVHYGVESCRACSSFFRRRVIECRQIEQRCDGKCDISTRRRGSCVKCRFQKCLDVGMRISAVYRSLQKYGSANLLDDVFLSNPSTLLKQIQNAYQHLVDARMLAFEMELKSDRELFKYHEMNQVLNLDFEMVTTSLLKFFESSTFVSCSEQNNNLRNDFLMKFFLLESGFKAKGNYELNLPNGNFMTIDYMEHFYSDQRTDTEHNALRIMKSYWNLMGSSLVADFGRVKIDFQEFLFLTSLLYWDDGIQNRSPESLIACRTMRNRVIKELSSYEEIKSIERDSSLRVGDVVLLLSTIQKALSLVEESRHISLVYNIYDVHYSMYEALSV